MRKIRVVGFSNVFELFDKEIKDVLRLEPPKRNHALSSNPV